MALSVSIVTGPRRSGKSTVISCIVKEACDAAPHYIRLASIDGSKRVPPIGRRESDDCGVATATWLDYNADSVFEVIPDGLSAIHKRDRTGCVIIEADSDPILRHAYMYDCVIFVMPAPQQLHDVFRTEPQARKALHSVLNDTATFAREVYGLFDESAGESDANTKRDMSDSQVIRFVRSPLGQQVASRIQLRPDYHGLIESDVVIVNTGTGSTSAAIDDVVARLERLMVWSCPDASRRPPLFCCDPCDEQDPRRQCLLDHLRQLHTLRPPRRRT